MAKNISKINKEWNSKEKSKQKNFESKNKDSWITTAFYFLSSLFPCLIIILLSPIQSPYIISTSLSITYSIKIYYDLLNYMNKSKKCQHFFRKFSNLKFLEIQPKNDLRESILSRFIFWGNKLHALILLYFGTKKELD